MLASDPRVIVTDLSESECADESNVKVENESGPEVVAEASESPSAWRLVAVGEQCDATFHESVSYTVISV